MSEIEDEDTVNGFKKFEIFWTQKLEEKAAFDNLSEEELTEKIDNVKKNCFILELQNEVMENYFRRHNPSTIRELNTFIQKQDIKKSTINTEKMFINENVFLENSLTQLTTMPTTVPPEKVSIGQLIEIVNQEIADLCMNSKTRKKAFDKEMLLLTCNLESYKVQASYLKNVLVSIVSHFPDQVKGKPAESNAKFLEIIKFMEDLIKKINIDIRRCSLELYSYRKEYSKLQKDHYHEDIVIPADLKLLKLHIEKLNFDLAKDRKLFIALGRCLDMKNAKFNSETYSLMLLQKRIDELIETINKLNKGFMDVNRYRHSLEKELNELKKKNDEIKELGSKNKIVTPKEYITLKGKNYDAIKKIKSMQKKIEYSPFSSEFKGLLNIE